MTKEKFIDHIEQFSKNYNIIFSNIDNLEKKYHIGIVENKVCRFCGRNSTETTFNTIAHAIPECLGNKKIICLDECDRCNEDFSNNIEVHLDKVTLPHRTMNMIKGKKKVPSYKTQDHKMRIDIENTQNRSFKIEAREDSGYVKFNTDDNNFILEYDLQSYIPSAAYKTLVKMSLSIMQNKELDKFKIMNNWIQEKDHSKYYTDSLKVFMTYVPGINPFKKTVVFLVKRHNNNHKYPEYMFILAFGNIMYQIIVPTDDEIKDKESTKTILYFLSPFEIDWKLGKIEHEILDWSQNTILKGHKQFMKFGYSNIKKLDPKSIKR